MNADALAQELRAEIDPQERLIWTGAPQPGLRFERGDLFAVPFSFLWGGFAIYWMVGVVTSGAPTFFVLFGIPFVAIGVYLIVGRFFTDSLRRARTRYALTNERALILSRFMGRTLQSVSVEDMGSVELIGVKTIRLTRDPIPSAGMLPRSWSMTRGRGSAFEDVEDAPAVLARIRELRRARQTS